MDIKIIAPLYVMLKRVTKDDRKMIINLNNYRNWHYIISNDTKIAYKEAIKDQIKGLKFKNKIRLNFQLFKGTKRVSDKANVLSIQEKFFCDALVECGCISDDKDEVIEDQHYSRTELDRENPRVEIIIETI